MVGNFFLFFFLILFLFHFILFPYFCSILLKMFFVLSIFSFDVFRWYNRIGWRDWIRWNKFESDYCVRLFWVLVFNVFFSRLEREGKIRIFVVRNNNNNLRRISNFNRIHYKFIRPRRYHYWIDRFLSTFSPFEIANARENIRPVDFEVR